MIKDRKFLAMAAIAAVAVLAACGGGGGSSVPGSTAMTGGGSNIVSATPTPAALATPTLAAGQALAHFAITLPTTTQSGARRARFIDASTKSITMTLLTNNGAAVAGSTVQGPYNLQAGQTGCVTTTTTTCTFEIAAPLGADVFVANTYSSLNAVGPLGSGAVSVNIQANATNAADLTLTGPIQTIVIASNNAANLDNLWNGVGAFYPISATQFNNTNNTGSIRRAVPQGTATATPTAIPSERLFLIAEDTQGNTIFNPTTYNQNVVLTLHLKNGDSANSVLSVVSPTNLGCVNAGGSTSADGGTVQVCSPFDVITLAISPNPPLSTSYYGQQFLNFPTVTATLPSPPTGFTPLVFPYVVQVAATPSPSPLPSPTGPTGSITVIGQ